MGLAYADEGFDDPNFSRKETNDFIEKINGLVTTFTLLPVEIYQGTPRHMDNWLLNRLSERVAKVTEAYERLETRTVVTEAFFEFLIDLRWYSRRVSVPGPAYVEALKTIVLLLAPIIPHSAEEIWSKWFPNSRTIFDTRWPSSEAMSDSTTRKEVDIFENSLKKLIQDIRNLLGIVKGSISVIEITLAPEWKYQFLIMSKDLPAKSLIPEAMKKTEFRALGKELTEFAKKSAQQYPTIPDRISADIEFIVLKEAEPFLKQEFPDKEFLILEPRAVADVQRLKRADPLRPSIFLR